LNKAAWYIDKAEEIHNVFSARLDGNAFDRDYDVIIVLRQIHHGKKQNFGMNKESNAT
jgi:hypothetical protein